MVLAHEVLIFYIAFIFIALQLCAHRSQHHRAVGRRPANIGAGFRVGVAQAPLQVMACTPRAMPRPATFSWLEAFFRGVDCNFFQV
jgi:hypothetical protein